VAAPRVKFEGVYETDEEDKGDWSEKLAEGRRGKAAARRIVRSFWLFRP
jgi:hypothetical protein